MLHEEEGKNHNKSARRQRERRLAEFFDVQRVILFKLRLTQALLPACCMAAGLVYTAALFALSSRCFWRGWKSSVSFPAKASGHTQAHIHTLCAHAHTHTHCHVAQNPVSWRLPVAGSFSLPLRSLSVSPSLARLLLPCSSLSNTWSIWVRVPGLKGLIAVYALFFCSVRFWGVIFRS